MEFTKIGTHAMMVGKQKGAFATMRRETEKKRLKKIDPVLVAAWILAILSAFAVTPDKTYLSYIDFRSLGILWSLMVIIQGFAANGVFEKIAVKMLRREKNGLLLSMVLVFLCFFSGMLITNDVALLTFVPFSVMVLKSAGREDLTLRVVVLQTVAANLGSMLTPIGNPQNLYIYGSTGMPFLVFVESIAPYTLLAVAMLVISIMFLPEKFQRVRFHKVVSEAEEVADARQIGIFGFLFFLAVLVVLRVFPWTVLAGVTAVVTFLTNRKLLKSADYVLLFTFVGFFIFTGNIGRIPFVHRQLAEMIAGHEFFTAIGISQIISNVPATLLMMDFVKDYQELLRGVNVGGLGTLIASMASLISYKIYGNAYPEKKGRYLLWFTGMNLMFLIGMIGLHQLSSL